jgi:hypothetical protein
MNAKAISGSPDTCGLSKSGDSAQNPGTSPVRHPWLFHNHFTRISSVKWRMDPSMVQEYAT